MDESPFMLPYRPAAILAAFSRASDEVARDAIPWLALPLRPDRSNAREIAGSMLRCALARAIEHVGRFRSVPPPQGVAWVRADAPTTHMAAMGFGTTAPALASHFDFCHVGDLELNAATAPGRGAA